MEPATLIDGLEIKLRQLSQRTERQRANYAAIVAENEQLKQELDRQRGIVNALRDKLERNQPEGETIEFCIQEIDRCLEWLHTT